ncbi:uncharacterized protein TrAtP1_008820 [Trichoderma atroviride]|uniref:uncharacterized protein n=1 Tax=Hypocrea atroviridis TaxID=63577 RepID=UPI00332AFA59|nr:hypothetical protein TrAtP1_008820 [Trichoderma atroviride]
METGSSARKISRRPSHEANQSSPGGNFAGADWPPDPCGPNGFAASDGARLAGPEVRRLAGILGATPWQPICRGTFFVLASALFFLFLFPTVPFSLTDFADSSLLRE